MEHVGPMYSNLVSHLLFVLEMFSICRTKQIRIGINSTAFGRKLTSAIPFSRFFGVFRVGKMMRSFQRPVELGRLGNELPVLGKANPLFKLVKCCAFKLTVLPAAT